MLNVINHEKYGEIIIEESFWTGKREIFINRQPLKKIGKREYEFKEDEKSTIVHLTGNFAGGLVAEINGEKIQLTPKLKWYETILPILLAVLIFVWGNNVQLCKIIPIVGGAIGGAIIGALTFFSIVISKSTKNILLKILIQVAMGILTFAACWLVATLILGLAAKK